MATKIDDRWLWLGLGAFIFLASKAVTRGLQEIRTLTEVHNPAPLSAIPPPSSFHSSSSNPENAIPTESLAVLARSPNVEISKAATKILCERFYADYGSRKQLYRDLKSRNKTVKHKAQLAHRLLADHRVVPRRRPSPLRELLSGANEDATLQFIIPARSAGRRGLRSDEQQDLRRRRREAVVINEGDRPVSQEDVYMRDGGGHMHGGGRDWDAEMERILREEHWSMHASRRGNLNGDEDDSGEVSEHAELDAEATLEELLGLVPTGEDARTGSPLERM